MAVKTYWDVESQKFVANFTMLRSELKKTNRTARDMKHHIRLSLQSAPHVPKFPECFAVMKATLLHSFTISQKSQLLCELDTYILAP